MYSTHIESGLTRLSQSNSEQKNRLKHLFMQLHSIEWLNSHSLLAGSSVWGVLEVSCSWFEVDGVNSCVRNLSCLKQPLFCGVLAGYFHPGRSTSQHCCLQEAKLLWNIVYLGADT